MPSALELIGLPLPAAQLEDRRVASSMRSGAERRAFQAALALNSYEGNARQAERVLGWGRETVQRGVRAPRPGLICLGAPAAFGGHRLWEAPPPAVAHARWALADSHSQHDPTFRTRLQYPRLTAAEAVAQGQVQGFPEASLPSLSTMAEVLNRTGYRRRKGIKANPKKSSRNPMPSVPTSPTRMARPSRRRRLTQTGRATA